MGMTVTQVTDSETAAIFSIAKQVRLLGRSSKRSETRSNHIQQSLMASSGAKR